jgi:hypothetical protein
MGKAKQHGAESERKEVTSGEQKGLSDPFEVARRGMYGSEDCRKQKVKVYIGT